MDVKDITYNKEILERFARIDRKGRLAHAYLLVGPAHTGKFSTALAVAKLVICEEKRQGQHFFCDACPSCRKIAGANHPDVHIIETAEGETAIRIHQVRDLLGRIKLRAFSAAKKVFIIKNIERMTADAANALLKTLEEPSDNSLLLLTTSVPEKNLETIRSRCHAVYFPAPASGRLAAQLAADLDGDRQSAHVLAHFSEGCYGHARMLKDQEFIKEKNAVIDEFILSDGGEPYIKKLLADKDRTQRFLDILLSWVHDGIILKAGLEQEKVVHIDRTEDLNRFVRRLQFEELLTLHEQIVNARKMLADNFNLKMPLLIIKERFHG